MKKIYILTCVLLSSLLIATSCSPEDKFLDPEKTTTGNVGAFLTSMINNQRFRSEYYQVRTIAADHTGVYAQTMLVSTGRDMYKQADLYITAYWRDFYTPEFRGPMAMFRQMEATNAKLVESEQAANEIFLQAGKVLLYDYGSGMIDIFGDIPFSEAGSILLTSTRTQAKFVDLKELYMQMIDDLDAIGKYFQTATSTTAFAKQDILNSGNVSQWQKYANSLRLRLLIHMSNSDEEYAKTKIMAMLNSPGEYPLIDGNSNPNYAPNNNDILNTPLVQSNTSDGVDLQQALNEGASSIAPDFMVNTVMAPVKDPRLAVLFDRNGKEEYIAMPINTSSEEIVAKRFDYACWDSTTVWMNRNLPGVRMTASEVNFIKAEAFERWGSTEQAKAAYETAVKQSVSFYYYLNSISPSVGAGFRYEAKPSDDEIADFVTKRVPYTGSATDKLKLIGTQKWLHFGWLQSMEAWTEYRRTKYPELLPFPTEGVNVQYPAPPTRFLYPADETTYNPNYSSVQAKDTRTTKIFWDVK